jgi:uncharacterized protein
MLSHKWSAALAALMLVPAGAGRAQEQPPLDLATYPRAALQVVHGGHHYRFDVWVAATTARAEQGLMWVHDLPASRGMIFPLTPPRVEGMWMKNCFIEIDMLFIDSGGRVVKIIQRAQPGSLDTLSSDVPVGAVLELKGGEAARLGLAVGDRVSWKTVSPRSPG